MADRGAIRQSIRNVPWNAREALMVFLVPWLILPVGALLILSQVAPYFEPARQFLVAYDNQDVLASFALVILEAVGSFAIIRHYLKKHHVGWQSLGINRFSVWDAIVFVVGLMIAFFFLVALAYTVVQLLLPSFNASQPQTTEFDNAAPSMQLYSLLALVIIPPIIEESVFRGFIFPAFSRRFGLVFGAIFSSALFGFAHLQLNVGVYTFILGLLLCFMYVRLGSIIPGMFLHMLNNYLSYTASHQIK